MKELARMLTLALLAAAPVLARAQSNLESDPAYLPIDKAIDLKVVRPQVNVNLPRFLILDAVSDLNGGPNDPFASAGINLSELVKDIKLIRVLVIESDDSNRAALTKGVAALRATLESHWIPIATVPEENVGVYALGDPSGETMAGLAALIHDGGDAVIVNIVGRVSIGKIIKIASRMDKFPKDLLKKLVASGGESSEKPAANSEESTAKK